MNNSKDFFEWFNEFAPEFKKLTGEVMDANHCLSAWNACVKSNSDMYTYHQIARRPGVSSAMKMHMIISSLKDLIKEIDAIDVVHIKDRSAILKAKAVIRMAMGE